jgi:hypothetical protein
MKETSKENSAAESYDFKKFFVSMIDSVIEDIKAVREQMSTERKDHEVTIKEEIKDLREEMKQDGKAPQDNMEIHMAKL